MPAELDIPMEKAAERLSTLQHEVPPCFPPKEWEKWLETHIAHSTKNDKHIKFMPDPRVSACEHCHIGYQIEQMMLGNCLPVLPDATPVAKRLAGIMEE